MSYQRGELVRGLELSRADVRELLLSARARADALEKLSAKLKGQGCHAEADRLDTRCTDITERLCTQLAAALDQPRTPDDD